MNSGTTNYNFEVQLSDISRGVHETLSLHVAQHPSETQEYLLTRVLAYCLEYCEGIAFSKGLADSEAPAIWMHDLTGQLTGWIEIGAPSAERLHRASKKVKHLAIYTYKDPANLLRQLQGERIQNCAAIMLHAIDAQFLGELKALLQRRNELELSVSEGQLYLNIGGKHLTTQLDSRSLAQ